MEVIISALITGGLALAGVIITNGMSNKSIENKLVTAQAVTDEKIDNLTKSLEKHTSTVEKVPVMEHQLIEVEKKVDKLECRVNSLVIKKA